VQPGPWGSGPQSPGKYFWDVLDCLYACLFTCFHQTYESVGLYVPTLIKIGQEMDTGDDDDHDD